MSIVDLIFRSTTHYIPYNAWRQPFPQPLTRTLTSHLQRLNTLKRHHSLSPAALESFS